MAASDSEPSVSGVDVTATGVHLSPFRDPNLEPGRSGVSGFAALAHHSCFEPDAEVPVLTLPASSTDFQDPRPASKAPGSIGRQARDKTLRGSSVDRMEMGGALDAVLAQDRRRTGRFWDS